MLSKRSPITSMSRTLAPETETITRGRPRGTRFVPPSSLCLGEGRYVDEEVTQGNETYSAAAVTGPTWPGSFVHRNLVVGRGERTGWARSRRTKRRHTLEAPFWGKEATVSDFHFLWPSLSTCFRRLGRERCQRRSGQNER